MDNEVYAEETTGDGSDSNTNNTLNCVLDTHRKMDTRIPELQRNPVIDRCAQLIYKIYIPVQKLGKVRNLHKIFLFT